MLKRILFLLITIPLIAYGAGAVRHGDGAIIGNYLLPAQNVLPLGSSVARWEAYVSSLNSTLSEGAAYIDSNGSLGSLTAVSLTELGYLDGVTSSIQAQLDAKLGTDLSTDFMLIGDGGSIASPILATDDSISSTIVKRDASGNASFNQVTADVFNGNVSGSASGNVFPTRQINTTSPLQGGGNLGADLTLTIDSADSTGSGVITTTAQDIAGEKRFLEAIGCKHVTTPANPAPGYLKIYCKADDKIYKLDSAGTETEIGTGTGGGTGSGEALVHAVSQTSHGFSIGDVVYFDGVSYLPALASADSTSEVLGVVSDVPDSNSFDLLMSGYISGLSGKEPGETYYLSATIAGDMSTSEPVTAGQISKPVFIAESESTGYVKDMRGAVVQSQSTGVLGSWDVYSPVVTGFGTITNDSFQYRVNGDSLQVRGFFTAGTTSAVLGTFTLPGTYVISTTKSVVANTSAAAGPQVGVITNDLAANQYVPMVTAVGTSTSLVYIGGAINVAGKLTPKNADNEFPTGAVISVFFEVPID